VIYKSLRITLLFSSSTAVGTEFSVNGVVVLVTMTSNSSETGTNGVYSSFGLRFFSSPSGRSVYPTTVVTGERRQVASFPEGNAVDYTDHANHLMLITRPSGRSFNLARTFLDAEPIGHDYNLIFGIEDEAQMTRLSLKGA